MKRWHEEHNIFYRQWKIHRKSHVDSNKDNGGRPGHLGVDPYIVNCECDNQVGRFRKKDAWDCGNSKCQMCHSDKYPKRQFTNQEELSKIKFKDSLKELRQKE